MILAPILGLNEGGTSNHHPQNQTMRVQKPTEFGYNQNRKLESGMMVMMKSWGNTVGT